MSRYEVPRRARIGVIGYFHETNSFADTTIDEATVTAQQLTGERLRQEHDGASTVIAGYLRATAEAGHQAIPLMYGELVPSGPLVPAAARRMCTDLVDSLRTTAETLDAVLVCLHGAASSVDDSDLDATILAALRNTVGADVPIGVTLDLHANVSERLLDQADIVSGYRTNPHVDAAERAGEVTKAIVEMIHHRTRPAMASVRVPAVISILAHGTSDEPMASIMAHLDRILTDDEVVTASVFEGFVWGDTPNLGMQVLVYTRTDAATAGRYARALAENVWAQRDQFLADAPGADEVCAHLPPGQTLLLDIGDNIGGGAPGDSAYLFQRALAHNLTSLIAIVNDEVAAGQAITAGEGATVELVVGREQLRLTGTVGAWTDGRYEDRGPTHVGHRFFDAGQSAAITLRDGQRLVLCSRAVMPSTPEQLRSLGIDPSEVQVILAKGVHSPLAGYRPLVDQVLAVDTPGPTANDFLTLRYHNRPRPLHPWESPTPRFTPRVRHAYVPQERVRGMAGQGDVEC